jgi:hypothetical protein
MATSRSHDSATVVVVGAFNPAIFQPHWFAKEGLLSQSDADGAKVDIVQSDLAQFTSSWLTWQSLRDRTTISTTDASRFSSLRDLVLGTFQLLRHTPVSAVGVNRGFHLAFDSRADVDAFAFRFAPQPPWSDLVNDSKLLSLHIEGRHPRGIGNKLTVLIRPSNLVQNGAFVQINTHFDCDVDGLLSGVETFWQQIGDFADFVAAELMDHKGSVG